jgi:O-6-methylguanine DNA methyltransferase
MASLITKEVWNATKRIPSGKVATYKDIARVIKHPHAFRAVGTILNKNTSLAVPCHRVICSDGKVGGYNRGTVQKIKILQQEGVIIKNRKIDLSVFRFLF